METRKFEVEIEGISPLLMNRFPEEEAEQKSKKRVGIANYDDDYDKSMYKDEKGVLYQPATHIEAALINAGKKHRVGRSTMTAIVKSSVFIEPDAIPHLIPKTIKDKRRVVIQRAAVMKTRAKLPEWKLAFEMVCTEEQLKTGDLKSLLDYAGQYIGIGDYRPRFGRFIVTKFEEQNGLESKDE